MDCRSTDREILYVQNSRNSGYQVFEGKQDLDKHLERRLRGWRVPDSYFLIMRDQDSGDCRDIKFNLQQMVMRSGRTNETVIVRIACHELESFYLGDLKAVESGMGMRNLARKQQSKKFRDPDQLANPVQELQKVTAHTYQKLDGSRRISQHLRLGGENTSRSFNILVKGIRTLFS